MFGIEKEAIIIGNPSIRIQKEYYDAYFDQQNRATRRVERSVFEYDYQRFLWAFILGVSGGQRKELEGPTKVAFKWDVIEKRPEVANKMIGLALYANYDADASRLKTDYLNMLEGEEGQSALGRVLRNSIEEFANAGFAIITDREVDEAGYLEDPQRILLDIQK